MKAVIVKKIDIELKNLQKDSDYYIEHNVDGISDNPVKEGEIPGIVEMRDVIYTRCRVSHPETNELINYFVKLDDRQLLNELLLISTSCLESKIDKGVKLGISSFKKKEMPKIESKSFSAGRDSVKKMKWWQRLFKKF